MYQIQDTATGELYRTHHGDAFTWETRGEAMKFADINFPGDLGRGVITIVPVQNGNPEYTVKVTCIRAIMGTMTTADQINLISELFELITPGEN